MSVTTLVTGSDSIGAECERNSGVWALNKRTRGDPKTINLLSSFDVHFSG